MSIEVFLFIIFICAAIAPIFAARRHTSVCARMRIGGIISLWLGLAIVMICAQFFWTKPPINREPAGPVQVVPTGGYAGSTACKSCHPHSYDTWHDSYHRTMTQAATEKTVIGNFDNVQLSGKDLAFTLFKKDNKFFAAMNNPQPDVFQVVITTGSHNRQAYWMRSSFSSDLVILPWMFLKEEKKWMPRHSGYINAWSLDDRPELGVLRSEAGRWERSCIQCHTTHGQMEALNVVATDDPARRVSGTLVTELGISCESCHGPGAEHVRVNQDPFHRYGQRLTGRNDPTIVNPAKLPHNRSAEVCGQCHVYKNFLTTDEDGLQWQKTGDTYRPGDDLSLHRFIIRGRSELMPQDRPARWNKLYQRETLGFWSDGMARATGREYTALLDSPCFQRGEMSCLSCHQMHQPAGESRKRSDWANEQLQLGMEGNGACVQCHDRFKSDVQLTQHTHHLPDSVGSSCYNCHMPFTAYGILKAERSHQISSPSVQESLQTGRMNACNQCHQDRTLAWTGDRLASWYKIAHPKLSEDETQVAATVLWALRGDAAQRGLMAWNYGWQDAYKASGNHWQAPYLGQLLEDRYDAVRIIANRSLRRLPGLHDFEFDPTRPLEQRASAHQKAVETWKRQQKSQKLPFAKEVLIDAQGQLMETTFQRLWKLRDDAAMGIAE